MKRRLSLPPLNLYQFYKIQLRTREKPSPNNQGNNQSNHQLYNPIPQTNSSHTSPTIFYFRSNFMMSYIYNIYTMLSSKKAAPTPEPRHPQGLISVKSLANIRCESNIAPSPSSNNKTFEKYEVILPSQNFQSELKMIEWRSKTQFPIVKILFYKILHKKLLNQCPVIQIAIEHFNTSLHSLPKMPLFQIFYLMKESIIGFERLLARFGTFDITNKMILINKNQKCRVWINENITLNYPTKRVRMAQFQFKNQILKVFEEKCINSTLSAAFFKDAYGIKTVLEVIQFVENFARSNKIILASKFNSIYESLGSKVDEIATGLHKFQTASMRKIPKFIQEMRAIKRLEKNVDSKSFDSPNNNIRKETNIRGLSHNKTKMEKLDISDIESTSKSILTPKSFASHEAKHDCRSINNQESSAIVKTISKKQSHQNFLSIFITSNQDRPEPLKTEKYTFKQKGEGKQNECEERGKYQLTRNVRCRKLSNGDDLSKVDNEKDISSQPKDNLALQRNKQTLTIPVPKMGRRKGEISLKNILENAPQINLNEENSDDIFSKNGWLKRFNSLTVDQFRDTVHSHFDGSDVLSDELRLTNLDLGILGAMGKQLRGSIFLQPQER